MIICDIRQRHRGHYTEAPLLVASRPLAWGQLGALLREISQLNAFA